VSVRTAEKYCVGQNSRHRMVMAKSPLAPGLVHPDMTDALRPDATRAFVGNSGGRSDVSAGSACVCTCTRLGEADDLGMMRSRMGQQNPRLSAQGGVNRLSRDEFWKTTSSSIPRGRPPVSFFSRRKARARRLEPDEERATSGANRKRGRPNRHVGSCPVSMSTRMMKAFSTRPGVGSSRRPGGYVSSARRDTPILAQPQAAIRRPCRCRLRTG